MIRLLGQAALEAARRTWRVAQPAFQDARRSLAQLALPMICAGCEQDLERSGELPLCSACRRKFTMPAETICSRCSAPAPMPAITNSGCLHCQDTTFRFERTAALGVYQGELRSFVLRMKHLAGESLSLASGQLLGQRILDLAWPERPDLITAAPMHWTRRVWRNVNAPAVIAEKTAAVLRLPLALELLRAVRMVPRQSTLTADQRRLNMRGGVFAVSAAFDLRDAHVLVIDDVMTTGATANALTRPLLKAGARTVSLGVVARSLME
jgi:predicted amidophosphoribosyltransferase